MIKKKRRTVPSGEFQTEITGLSHDGRGVAHANGKVIFIDNALPGETVQYRYLKCHSQFDEAQSTAILTASIERVAAACPHFGVCGGCKLQHYSHSAQLIYKQKTLLEMLQHQAHVQPKQILPPIFDNVYGYRRKARLGVKHVLKKNKIVLGFRERDGRFIADCQECHILHPAVGKKLAALSQMLEQLIKKADIPQIEVAIGDEDHAIIIRHTAPLPEQDSEKLKNFCQEHQLRLYLQPNGLDSIHLLYPAEKNPLLYYQLEKYDLKLNFAPQQFTQINHEVNQKMIDCVLELLDLQTEDKALDLFCGIGNFSLPMAKYCSSVTGVEGDANSVAQAEYNAKYNNLDNCKFYLGNLFEENRDASWTKQVYNKILLDPPRCGAKEILPWLSAVKPQRIAYVSCNPLTLARDTGILVKQGYELTHAGIIDMFPHTQHVETIALFQPR